MKEVEIKDPASIQALQEEILIHRRWRHPHIVQYLGSEVSGNTLRIFMEQVPGGSLSDLLRNMWGPLNDHPEVMSDYTRQILKVRMMFSLVYCYLVFAGLGLPARARHSAPGYQGCKCACQPVRWPIETVRFWHIKKVTFPWLLFVVTISYLTHF